MPVSKKKSLQALIQRCLALPFSPEEKQIFEAGLDQAISAFSPQNYSSSSKSLDEFVNYIEFLNTLKDLLIDPNPLLSKEFAAVVDQINQKIEKALKTQVQLIAKAIKHVEKLKNKKKPTENDLDQIQGRLLEVRSHIVAVMQAAQVLMYKQPSEEIKNLSKTQAKTNQDTKNAYTETIRSNNILKFNNILSSLQQQHYSLIEALKRPSNDNGILAKVLASLDPLVDVTLKAQNLTIERPDNLSVRVVKGIYDRLMEIFASLGASLKTQLESIILFDPNLDIVLKGDIADVIAQFITRNKNASSASVPSTTLSFAEQMQLFERIKLILQNGNADTTQLEAVQDSIITQKCLAIHKLSEDIYKEKNPDKRQVLLGQLDVLHKDLILGTIELVADLNNKDEIIELLDTSFSIIQDEDINTDKVVSLGIKPVARLYAINKKLREAFAGQNPYLSQIIIMALDSATDGFKVKVEAALNRYATPKQTIVVPAGFKPKSLYEFARPPILLHFANTKGDFESVKDAIKNMNAYLKSLGISEKVILVAEDKERGTPQYIKLPQIPDTPIVLNFGGNATDFGVDDIKLKKLLLNTKLQQPDIVNINIGKHDLLDLRYIEELPLISNSVLENKTPTWVAAEQSISFASFVMQKYFEDTILLPALEGNDDLQDIKKSYGNVDEQNFKTKLINAWLSNSNQRAELVDALEMDLTQEQREFLYMQWADQTMDRPNRLFLRRQELARIKVQNRPEVKNSINPLLNAHERKIEELKDLYTQQQAIVARILAAEPGPEMRAAVVSLMQQLPAFAKSHFKAHEARQDFEAQAELLVNRLMFTFSQPDVSHSQAYVDLRNHFLHAHEQAIRNTNSALDTKLRIYVTDAEVVEDIKHSVSKDGVNHALLTVSNSVAMIGSKASGFVAAFNGETQIHAMDDHTNFSGWMEAENASMHDAIAHVYSNSARDAFIDDTSPLSQYVRPQPSLEAFVPTISSTAAHLAVISNIYGFVTGSEQSKNESKVLNNDTVFLHAAGNTQPLTREVDVVGISFGTGTMQETIISSNQNTSNPALLNMPVIGKNAQKVPSNMLLPGKTILAPEKITRNRLRDGNFSADERRVSWNIGIEHTPESNEIKSITLTRVINGKDKITVTFDNITASELRTLGRLIEQQSSNKADHIKDANTYAHKRLTTILKDISEMGPDWQAFAEIILDRISTEQNDLSSIETSVLFKTQLVGLASLLDAAKNENNITNLATSRRKTIANLQRALVAVTNALPSELEANSPNNFKLMQDFFAEYRSIDLVKKHEKRAFADPIYPADVFASVTSSIAYDLSAAPAEMQNKVRSIVSDTLDEMKIIDVEQSKNVEESKDSDEQKQPEENKKHTTDSAADIKVKILALQRMREATLNHPQAQKIQRDIDTAVILLLKELTVQIREATKRAKEASTAGYIKDVDRAIASQELIKAKDVLSQTTAVLSIFEPASSIDIAWVPYANTAQDNRKPKNAAQAYNSIIQNLQTISANLLDLDALKENSQAISFLNFHATFYEDPSSQIQEAHRLALMSAVEAARELHAADLRLSATDDPLKLAVRKAIKDALEMHQILQSEIDTLNPHVEEAQQILQHLYIAINEYKKKYNSSTDELLINAQKALDLLGGPSEHPNVVSLSFLLKREEAELLQVLRQAESMPNIYSNNGLLQRIGVSGAPVINTDAAEEMQANLYNKIDTVLNTLINIGINSNNSLLYPRTLTLMQNLLTEESPMSTDRSRGVKLLLNKETPDTDLDLIRTSLSSAKYKSAINGDVGGSQSMYLDAFESIIQATEQIFSIQDKIIKDNLDQKTRKYNTDSKALRKRIKNLDLSEKNMESSAEPLFSLGKDLADMDKAIYAHIQGYTRQRSYVALDRTALQGIVQRLEKFLDTTEIGERTDLLSKLQDDYARLQQETVLNENSLYIDQNTKDMLLSLVKTHLRFASKVNEIKLRNPDVDYLSFVYAQAQERAESDDIGIIAQQAKLLQNALYYFDKQHKYKQNDGTSIYKLEENTDFPKYHDADNHTDTTEAAVVTEHMQELLEAYNQKLEMEDRRTYPRKEVFANVKPQSTRSRLAQYVPNKSSFAKLVSNRFKAGRERGATNSQVTDFTFDDSDTHLNSDASTDPGFETRARSTTILVLGSEDLNKELKDLTQHFKYIAQASTDIGNYKRSVSKDKNEFETILSNLRERHANAKDELFKLISNNRDAFASDVQGYISTQLARLGRSYSTKEDISAMLKTLKLLKNSPVKNEPVIIALRSALRAHLAIEALDLRIHPEKIATNKARATQEESKPGRVSAFVTSVQNLGSNAREKMYSFGRHAWSTMPSMSSSHQTTVSFVSRERTRTSSFAESTHDQNEDVADILQGLLHNTKKQESFLDSMRIIGEELGKYEGYHFENDTLYVARDDSSPLTLENSDIEFQIPPQDIDATKSVQINLSGSKNSWEDTITGLLLTNDELRMAFALNEADALQFIQGLLSTIRDFDTCGIEFAFKDLQTATEIHGLLSKMQIEDMHGNPYPAERIDAVRAFLKPAFEEHPQLPRLSSRADLRHI